MTNKFTRKAASCKLCVEYSAKQGCTSRHCPYLSERVAAGALNYNGTVMEAFQYNPMFRGNLVFFRRRLSESIWNGAEHRRCMEALRLYTGRDKRCGHASALQAFLLSAADLAGGF